ncbi:hypothetical protein C486_01624 [Natrinema gari JCM 14663]|uniref:Uncharacterized protein n=1 Tax=Natrinema gari JCM 14663 TaxID=1230459 RepID=L9ZFB4_9EURY|nr:hypothetical protein C486_01624 [Natrinema gari JCM 14663]
MSPPITRPDIRPTLNWIERSHIHDEKTAEDRQNN